MAYVCQEWFPMGSYKGQRQEGFYMDNYLKRQLDVLIKNIHNDWDFTIVISGQGEMRVGKSLLAMQIGAYWTYQLERIHDIAIPFNVKENFVLNGSELMDKGNNLGQNYEYPSMIFDEAADDLESTKVLKATTQAIKDYLRKAAQYNMLNLIVQSEFFEIPKPIAISRSIFLIDVSYNIDEEGKFERGYFRFFSRRSKKALYIKGKRELNYYAHKPDFNGTFPNVYTVDEKEYRKEKSDSLTRWKHMTSTEIRRQEWFKGALKLLYQQEGFDSHRELANKISKVSKFRIHYRTIGKLLEGEKVEEEDFEELKEE